jgi:hypothetical protein
MFRDLYLRHCSWEACPKNASVYAAGLDNRRLLGIANLCPEHASVQALQSSQVLPKKCPEAVGYVCADLSFIGCSEQGSMFLLVTNSKSVLAIPSGPCEGLTAIGRFALPVGRLSRESPGALLAVINEYGGKSECVTITKCIPPIEGVSIQARYKFTRDGNGRLLDVKTTDGLSLALFAKIPIFIHEEVLESFHNEAFPPMPWDPGARHSPSTLPSVTKIPFPE